MTDPPAKGAARIAVVIPCYNEELTVAKVVRDFRQALPQAEIYVFDNNSSDRTAAEARAAGAMVIREKRKGKGFVVAAMMVKVDADYYLMVDGDDTYPAEQAMDLLKPLLNQEADMVVGQRLAHFTDRAFRPLHVGGNKLVRNLINLIFSANVADVMSGYRAFTRELAESIPVIASGFEVETELTLQVLAARFVIKEVPIPYRERPSGSASKLRTFRDGIRVLLKIFGIAKAYKPMTFFGGLGLLTILFGLLPGTQLVVEYLRSRSISSAGHVVWCTACLTVGMILFSIGVTLHTVNFRFQEIASSLAKQIRCGRRSTAAGGIEPCVVDSYTIPLAAKGSDGESRGGTAAAGRIEHPAAA
jgi:glycosyltransferase involved in cell wall biosynthesis